MDHLPEPSSPAYGHPQVPYLEGFVYDESGFRDFPSRMGFDKTRLLAGNFTEHRHSVLAAFLRSWLFFGMMSEVFGISVNVDDFVVEQTPGQKTVTTKHSLRPYIKRWLSNLEHDHSPNVQDRISRCLQEANSYAIHLSGGHLGETLWPLPPEVSISIMILGATLESALFHN